MKKILCLCGCFFILLIASAQKDSIEPPYKRFPGFPPVKLLNTDSTSWFTKNDLPKKSAVMLMIFNPGCEHCRHETEEILKRIGEFKKIQIIMTTFMPFDSMMAFRKKYQLDQYENVIVGQDTHYFLPTFYNIGSLPFLAFYNRKKELIRVFEGTLPVDEILSTFRDAD